MSNLAQVIEFDDDRDDRVEFDVVPGWYTGSSANDAGGAANDHEYRADDNATGVSQKRYRYTGKERDEETSLYYHGARYYASWLGRWTAADPIGLGDGINRFAYVSNNPVRLVDPGGTDANDPEEPNFTPADPAERVSHDPTAAVEDDEVFESVDPNAGGAQGDFPDAFHTGITIPYENQAEIDKRAEEIEYRVDIARRQEQGKSQPYQTQVIDRRGLHESQADADAALRSSNFERGAAIHTTSLIGALGYAIADLFGGSEEQKLSSGEFLQGVGGVAGSSGAKGVTPHVTRQSRIPVSTVSPRAQVLDQRGTGGTSTKRPNQPDVLNLDLPQASATGLAAGIEL